jgi:hypothetical protein
VNSATGAVELYNGTNWVAAMPQQLGTLNTLGVRIPESAPSVWIDASDNSTVCLALTNEIVLSAYNKVGTRDALFASRGVNLNSAITTMGRLTTVSGRKEITLPTNTFTGYALSVPRGNIQIRNTQFTCAVVCRLTSVGNTNSTASAFAGLLNADQGNYQFGLNWNGSAVSPRVIFNAATANPATPLSAAITALTTFMCIFGVDPVTGMFLKLNGGTATTVAYAQQVAYTCFGFGTPPGSLPAAQFFNSCQALSEAIVWPYSIYNNTSAVVNTEGYLAWKWNLVSDLPVGHPYKSAPPANGTYIIT